jgi:hypothetical protein
MLLFEEECVPGLGSISPHVVFPAVNELRSDLVEASEKPRHNVQLVMEPVASVQHRLCLTLLGGSLVNHGLAL